MTLFDFYLMCDNIDSNWTLDIRESGRKICKANFYVLPAVCRQMKIEYFKLNEESKNCIICIKA